MTDFLRVAPPPDGLQLAMAAARRRRWRVASLTTTAGASLALVVPLLLGGGGQSVLVPEPDPQQPAVTVSHSPAPAGVPNVATSKVTTPAVAVRIQQPGGAPVVDVRHTPTRDPAPGRPYAAGPIDREDNVYATFGAVCFRSDGSKPTGLCTGVRSIRDGEPGVVLQADLCNVDATPASVRFPTSREVDFVVRSSKSGEVWRWSRWHPARQTPHSLTVEPSACDHWTFRWTEVDAGGRRLPAGDYTLSVTYGSAGLDPANTTFTL